MRTVRSESWVVYLMPVKGVADGRTAVCSQAEWDKMQAERPGYHTLVRAGIANEGEAERLARGTSGDTPPRSPRLHKIVVVPLSPETQTAARSAVP